MEKDYLYLNDMYTKKLLKQFIVMHIYIYIFQGVYIRYIVCSVFSKTVVTLSCGSAYSVHLCVVPSEGLHCANHHSNIDKRFFSVLWKVCSL